MSFFKRHPTRFSTRRHSVCRRGVYGKGNSPSSDGLKTIADYLPPCPGVAVIANSSNAPRRPCIILVDRRQPRFALHVIQMLSCDRRTSLQISHTLLAFGYGRVCILEGGIETLRIAHQQVQSRRR